MGNKCSNKDPKDRPDAALTALEIIREAQRKYFNSHIEDDQDDSFDDCDLENSIDLDDDPFETTPLDSSVIVGTTNILLSTINTAFDDTASSASENGTLTKKNTNANRDGNQTTATAGNNGTDSNTGKQDVTQTHGGTPKESGFVKRREKAKYIRLSKRGNFFSIFNTEDKKARCVDPKMYLYPFENIVFEGGGNKGLAYCGAVRLLEELNIWPQIKRLAGTSAGAMTASLLAVGYNSHDLEQFFSLNLNKIFLDHKFGYLSLLPNLLTSYGWNPGNRIYKWFGQRICEKTGDMDTTFKQVYERYHRELCVVVTNLNQMTTLYCHPKTTPDMPVRLAVRMSMSIPGMFKAVKHTLYGQTDIYVDGGVLCNYPIHCFDGWWLSMKPEDNFLEKLQPLEDIPRLLERSERFGTYNEKTLGMQLYSDNEQDLLKYQLENLRHGVELQELPNTKLAREKIKKKKLQLKTDREHRRLVKAMNSFLHALNKHNVDKNEHIDRQELQAALDDDSSFPRKRRLMLFGDVESDIILDYLDKDHNGQISFDELLSFMEDTGISMQNRFLGYQRRIIDNLPSFLDTLQATLLTNVKRVYVEERDLKRTVGINTGHVATSDFVLEPADVEFIIERGRRSLEAFLKYSVATHNLKKRPEFRHIDDIRKNSKDHLTPNSSNQSLLTGNSEPALTVPNGTVPKYSLSSFVSKAEFQDAKSHSSPTRDDLSIPVLPQHISACRTKSGSSGKSVSISDKVEIMGDKVWYDSNLCEQEQTDNFSNVPEESDCIFLLGDSTDAINPGNTHEGLTSNSQKLLKESTTLQPHSTKLTSSLFNTHKGVSSTTKEHGRKLIPSLKVDVQVHKPREKPESPTTPLLHGN